MQKGPLGAAGSGQILRQVDRHVKKKIDLASLPPTNTRTSSKWIIDPCATFKNNGSIRHLVEYFHDTEVGYRNIKQGMIYLLRKRTD